MAINFLVFFFLKIVDFRLVITYFGAPRLHQIFEEFSSDIYLLDLTKVKQASRH